MTEPCIIKSTKNGLGLVLDNNIDFKELVLFICEKFSDSKSFFGKTSLILTVEGRELSGEEIAVIIEAIELNSDIKISLIEQNDTLKDARMAEKLDRFYFDEFYQNAKIVPGTVGRNEEVISEGSILVLGDVKKGALVRAKGNIIIIGSVKGEVHAGKEGEKSAYIVANSFDSETVRIADTSDEIITMGGGFFKRAPKEPQAVVLWEDGLLVEPLSKGIIKQLVK